MHVLLGLELARLCTDRLLEAETEAERAQLYLATGQHREALRSLDRAHRLFTELRAEREVLDVERRLRALEQLYLDVGRRWGELVEAKDHYTAGHCQRVAEHACALAAAVGIPERELTWFRVGALLHDVGKTEVPERVLNKPGPLDTEEWTEMREHTLKGDRIVAELGFPWDIRPLVRSHHERWDGSGYPDGLSGEDIPLPARILAVADVYDALTTDRPYRPAFRRADALRIMEQEAGRSLDPQLFRTFRGLIEDESRPAR
jgi:putative nucleotidyltransferase with HDIG domain